jgi:hypothetical protein
MPALCPDQSWGQNCFNFLGAPAERRDHGQRAPKRCRPRTCEVPSFHNDFNTAEVKERFKHGPKVDPILTDDLD